MLKIAITGGAGTGKSTVARMFAELGAEVLDADAIAREAVAVGAPAWEELRRLYGADYFHENGELNRSKLAQLVFADPEARRRLDGLIHPRVEAELRPGWRSWRAGAWRWCWWRCRSCSKPAGRRPLTGSSWWRPRKPMQIRRLRGRDGRGEAEIRGHSGGPVAAG